ncbi:Hypothetical protein POVR1_LOCUS11 [uncultured virus]|nr:Hypothetical protein POVR1_LOCUS11 [uncultured virus]
MDARIMYIEDVGVFDSNKNREMFTILPESAGEVSFDPTGPRYIIKVGTFRGGVTRYLQFNPESGKDRIILVDFPGSVDLTDPEIQKFSIENITSSDWFDPMATRLFDEGEIMELYQAQQIFKQSVKQITVIGKLIGLDMHGFISSEIRKMETPRIGG